MSFQELIRKDNVVVFSLTYCPHSARVKALLRPITVHIKVYEVDQMSNGDYIRRQIREKYKHETLPAVFIYGKFYGGASDIASLQQSGKLVSILHAGLK